MGHQDAPVVFKADFTGHTDRTAGVRSQCGYLLLVAGGSGVGEQAALKATDSDVRC